MPMPVGQIGNSVPMPVGQIGNSVPMSRRLIFFLRLPIGQYGPVSQMPMSRRLNRESPCEARGLFTPGPTPSFLGKIAHAY